MNIGKLLKNSILELKRAGIPSAELDARVLLEHATSHDTPFLYSHPDSPITNADYGRFRRYIRRRKKGEPIAYIVKHKEFFGYDFFVNKNVLIPRPETEWLVEEAIKHIEKCHSRPDRESRLDPCLRGDDKTVDNATLRILDVGAGSGNIIISMALSLSSNSYRLSSLINFYGADIGKKAIGVARKNAKKLEVKNVKFYLSDLFSNPRLPRQFDLIIANLPYVPSSTRIKNSESRIMDDIYFEPQDAIFSEDNGTAIIKKFLCESVDHIEKNGLILIELDPRNAKALHSEAKKFYTNVELKKDLAGKDRYLIIKK